MTKQYKAFRRRLPKPGGGGFFEAIQMALVDMSCLGERRFDLSGYPHESEADALMSDWVALGGDMQHAIEEISKESRAGGRSEQTSIEETEGRTASGRKVSAG